MTIQQLAQNVEQIAPYVVKIAGSGAKALVVRYNLEKLAKKSYSRFEEVCDEMGKSKGKFLISDPLCRDLEMAGMNE